MKRQFCSGLLSLFRPAALLISCALLPAAAQTARPAAVRHQAEQRFLRGRRGTRKIDGARALAAARALHLELLAHPQITGLSAPWMPVGPAQVQSAFYGAVTGRVTSLVLDPADATGNTLYVGTTGGGVWKSSNAAGPVSAMSFQPLTDTLPVYSANAGTSVLPSLSIGALAMANGVLLAGTGDPNDASDSYYGAGILRSTDGGATWTLAQGSRDGAAGNHDFFSLGTAGLAFSSLNPQIAVAAMTQATEGTIVNAADSSSTLKGLYYSNDAGLTWHLSTLQDGSQVFQAPGQTSTLGASNAATSVVWNAQRQLFFAAVQFHGYYQSADGQTWTRLAHQPAGSLSAANCPPNPGSAGAAACPIFRGGLAVQATTGDTFALTTSSTNTDQGLTQDVCAATGSTCASAIPLFASAITSTPLEQGSGSAVIAQADYNLSLAAVASGADTILYAGTLDLYRCTLTAGLATTCALRNTTNAQNGCLNRAGVAPAQHALAALGSTLFLGNDGGLYRTQDTALEAGQSCNANDAAHFQNLNPALGSLAEAAFIAQDPADPNILLAGLGALGTAGTGAAANGAAWTQLATGEGGQVAIDPATPVNWYVSSNAGVSIARCSKGTSCKAADFAAASATIGPTQVAGDNAAVDVPYVLDPAATNNLLLGTCRAWRGPAGASALWSAANSISRPFGGTAATGCSATFPVVRSLAAGGAAVVTGSAQTTGSQVLYAGLAGALDGGTALPGHVFATFAANLAGTSTVWADLAKSPVTNDLAGNNVFNPGGFDVSSLAVDPHDATGRTVYATVMGFPMNGVDAPRIYRSVDGGAHWLNISSNLPNAPANSVVVDPNDANTLYLALDTGVYVTTQVTGCSTGNCWSVYGAMLPNAPAITLAAAAAMPTDDGRLGELRVGTYGRGIWQIPLLSAVSPAAPAISLNPAALAFAAQAVGTLSAAQIITVTNSGNAPLTVSSVLATGDFAVSSTCTQTPVAQGASCTVSVQFQPTATGARMGQLTVYGNVSGGQALAQLSGTGTPPATVVLTPIALSFPSTSTGSSSAVENVTVSNTGGAVTNLQSIAATGDFKISANSCGKTLGASSGCTVSVVFAPTASGARSGTLTVQDDAGTQTASLSGTGTAPATDTLAPVALTFSAQRLNTLSAAQAVTLTNAGDVPLTLIAAQIASGDFTVVNSCGNSLPAHSSCTLNVSFAPRSVGMQTGLLTVADQFRSQTVSLNGTGLAPPGVSLSPTNGLSFGALAVGSSSPAQAVTLTNNGGVPLMISSVKVSGDFALQPGTNTCGMTLAPAAVCTIGVTFNPVAAGVRGGSLTLTDDAANSPQTLVLSGTGVDFSLMLSGSGSMTVTSGQVATYALLLSAPAGIPGSADFTCSGVPAHSKCTVNPASATLTGTTPVTVTIATGLTTAKLDAPLLPWSTKTVVFAGLLGGLLLVRRRRVPALLCCLLLVVLAGCSTPRTVPGVGTSVPSTPVITPAGTYAITVTGSSAGLVRTVNLTLVVQ